MFIKQKIIEVIKIKTYTPCMFFLCEENVSLYKASIPSVNETCFFIFLTYLKECCLNKKKM